MSSPPRVRFAPSPTGELHLGNARTALFNYLFARKYEGTLILRIEDTDRERSRPDYERALLRDLRWLGISWEEGPDVGGPFAPYRQSEAEAIFRHHLEILRHKDAVYPCFCSREELEQERELSEKLRKPPRYSGKCRKLSRAERDERFRKGIPYVWRLRYPPDSEIVHFDDLIRGRIEFLVENLGGDLVLTRTDGTPTYQFAVVVDDHRMQITHVLRGEDHLTNTAKQILIYRAFEWDPPLFGHFPMILGMDRSKLSKRHGALSLSQYRGLGVIPEGLMNYLALLGFSPGEEEVLSPQELCRRFELKDVGVSPAIFDPRKLFWVNGVHLRRLNKEEFVVRALQWFEEYSPPLLEKVGRERLSRLLPLYQDSITHLAELEEKLTVFYEPRGSEGSDQEKIVAMNTFTPALSVAEERLAFLPPEGEERVVWFKSVVEELLRRTGARGKEIYQPLRLIFTGQPHGPDLSGLICWIPQRVLKDRLKYWKEHTS